MNTVTTLSELSEKTRSAWSRIDAPTTEDMRNMRRIAGERAAEAFVGVKPVDVDISASGFQTAAPLLDLPGRAAAAYLGTYLLALLREIELEEKAGFPVDINTRVHTLVVLSSSRFFSDIAEPYLPADCLAIVGEIAEMLVDRRDPLELGDDMVARLERLIRSIKRALSNPLPQ